MSSVFHVHSPHDVYAAAIVAGLRELTDPVLAISSGHAPSEVGVADQIEHTAAEVGRWTRSVRLPASHLYVDDDRGRMHQVAGWRRYRRTMADHLSRVGLDGTRELFINCLHHRDTMALARSLPGATQHFFPHGLSSFHSGEAVHYQRNVANSPSVASQPGKPARGLYWRRKYQCELTHAYTFNEPIPWAVRTYDISDQLTSGFDRWHSTLVSTSVKREINRIATKPGVRPILLLLNPADRDGGDRLERSYEAALASLCQARSTVGGDWVLLKGHPRSDFRWSAKIANRLGAQLGLEVECLNFAHVPIELVAPRLGVSAVVALGTTSSATIAKQTRVPTIVPASYFEDLFEGEALVSSRRWLAKNKKWLQLI